MQRRLNPALTCKPNDLAFRATLLQVGMLALALTISGTFGGGCALDHGGLTVDPDAGSPSVDADDQTDVPADLPIDQTAPPDASCNACDPGARFVTLPGGRFTGTTAGDSASAGSCGGADAPEAVFKIELTASSDLFVTTHGTGFNTVVYLRRAGCCGDEVDCNDDADGRATSVLAERGLAAGTYYIIVDGASADDAGDFTLDIYATPASTNVAEACGSPIRIGADPVTGNTCGYQDDYGPLPGCSAAMSGTSGLDQVYYFVLDAPAEVTFSTCNDTCIDTVLYVRDVCSDNSSQRACDDDSCRASGSCLPEGNQVQSRVTVTLSAGAHYLVLDTFAASQIPCGAFTITPTGVP
jgi:hypothetical protein